MARKRAIAFDPNFKNRGKGRRRGKVSVDVDAANLTGSLTFYSPPEPPENGYIIVSDSNTAIGIAAGSAKPVFWTADDSTIVSIVNGLPGNNTTVSTVADAFSYLASNNYYIISPTTSETVTNGLVLELDASRISSYPSGGTTWYDLSGNNHNCTLNNGPTFNSDRYISFDGTNDYAPFTSEYGFNTGGGTDYTFEVLFKMRTLPTAQYGANGHIWGGENGNDVVLYLNPASSGVSRGIMVYDDSRYNTNHMTTGGFEADTWAQWVIVGDGTNHTITHYINGKLDRSATSVVSSQQVRTWGGTRFAFDARWGTHSTLDLAIARQYTRKLTAAEVAQNFYKGPIVTNGLILALDAANPVCFEPGNTTCKNLVTGGNVSGANGTPGSGTHTPNASNFPSYNSINGGVFDFVGGKGMNCDEDLGFTSTRTLMMWFYKNSSNGQYFSDARNNGGQWFLSNYSGENINYTDAMRYNFGSSYNASHPDFLNKWWCMTVVSDNNGSRLYLNGEEVNSYVSQNSIDEDFGKNFRIGTRYTTSSQWTGYFGPILAYNRVLSNDEIVQNYNAYKSRFL